jgi:hypothetical protein
MIVLAAILVLWFCWQIARSGDAFAALHEASRTADSRLAMHCGRNPYDTSIRSESARRELLAAGRR